MFYHGICLVSVMRVCYVSVFWDLPLWWRVEHVFYTLHVKASSYYEYAMDVPTPIFWLCVCYIYIWWNCLNITPISIGGIFVVLFVCKSYKPSHLKVFSIFLTQNKVVKMTFKIHLFFLIKSYINWFE